eukprot:GCRY01001183.1.p1 GENE.GCRY01001183.1~~GCRY01001183.1.p1  ORF type:complete len:189 (+),score=4.69 GCRY01001183.1:305-871(+)
MPPKISDLLYVGSTWEGFQTNESTQYPVKIVLQHVDLEQSFLCGYLKIEQLTEEYPVLTTYFEGEIIGKHHGFGTRKWSADSNVDAQHWGRFPSFSKHFSEYLLKEPCELPEFDVHDTLFMRWKEIFLVPNHQVHTIHGASFAGFYYIVFDHKSQMITGFYYHQDTQWFQELRLQYVLQRNFGCCSFN